MTSQIYTASTISMNSMNSDSMNSEKTELYPILNIRNAHPRDKNIHFEEEGHKYTILGECGYTSVTTWIHTHFALFDADLIISRMMSGKAWKAGHKYWGLTADGIKDLWDGKRDSAAGAGTKLHYEIECFMNSNVLIFDYTHLELLQQYQIMSKYDKKYLDFGVEWSYFLKFVADFPQLKPYRTEWTVYHEDLKMAGSIDMVYENPDGSLSIYDWKRSADIVKLNSWNKCAITKEIDWMPDSNFWHYALQLNTYKMILESKYGKVVKDLYLVRLHPDSSDYELIQVPELKHDLLPLFPLLEKVEQKHTPLK